MASDPVPIIVGFPPISNAKVEVLILGSMPSIVSLRKQQYYGHQRNAFWPIMMELLSGPANASYQERQKILLSRHIAVWDVLQSCQRAGSLDADIDAQSIKTNDFFGFYRAHRAVKKVFFNGSLAEKVYRKQVLPDLKEEFDYLEYQRLPSTSPAHASMSLARKLEKWAVILDFIGQG